jgi:LysR family transcriptional regulator, transcriptional activator of nhaA
MEWLNFHHLRYFWTVAKTESVRKAAEQLHVSQPSISAQLKLLEETLGQKLFQRSGRNLVLTEVGQLVLSYADEIFSIGRELMSAVKQRPGNRALRFNVGMTDVAVKANRLRDSQVGVPIRRSDPHRLPASGDRAAGQSIAGASARHRARR